MQFSISQQTLSKGLATVSRSVAANSSMPILSHVLIAATAGEVSLAANDLDTGTTCRLTTEVAANGAVSVPAKLFTEIVRGLPAELLPQKLNTHGDEQPGRKLTPKIRKSAKNHLTAR